MANDLDARDKREEVEKILGNPIFDEFPEHTLRIRRNLLIIASIASIYKLYGLSISSGGEVSLGGIKLSGLTNVAVDQIMFVLVVYHLIHFFWNSVTHLQRWRVRVTGTKLAHVTTGKFSSDAQDYPNDPIQSSLYTWWVEQAPLLRSIGRHAEELRNAISDFRNQTEGARVSAGTTDISELPRVLSEIERGANNLAARSDDLARMLSSGRITVSLERFDKWFWLFQWNQIARWFVIEFLLPIIVGIGAAWLTWPWIGR